MAYKIAIASSDGKTVDLHLGSAPLLKIYTADGLDFQFLEDRSIETQGAGQSACQEGCAGGSGSGCSGGGNPISVETIADCRAVVAAKVGKNARRLLELRAISVFDIEIPVDEALSKITSYYDKLDHKTFGIKK